MNYSFLTSKERDVETGLDYFGARYYSSIQGRFTSSDEPFMDQFQSNPQSWLLYSYARNNPLRLVDPSGNRAEDPCPECPDGPPFTAEEIDEHDRQVEAGEIHTIQTTINSAGHVGKEVYGTMERPPKEWINREVIAGICSQGTLAFMYGEVGQMVSGTPENPSEWAT